MYRYLQSPVRESSGVQRVDSLDADGGGHDRRVYGRCINHARVGVRDPVPHHQLAGQYLLSGINVRFNVFCASTCITIMNVKDVRWKRRNHWKKDSIGIRLQTTEKAYFISLGTKV